MRDGMRLRQRERLAWLASKQHGVFSLAQAEELGYTRSDLFRRTRAGRLRRMFPQVYRIVGAPPSLEQRAMAAALWAGPQAVISHDTAAALWGLRRPDTVLHVTVARKPGACPRGICVHRCDSFAARDRGKLHGIPVTSVPRTLLDLAAGGSGDVRPVVERAVLDDLVTVDQLRDVVARNRGRRGCRRLASLFDEVGSSALERRIDDLLQRSGLPAYEREFVVGRYRLDFAWPEQRAAIEADGRRWHSGSDDFLRDRAKHNALVAEGWRILRVTWRDLDRPGDIVAAARSLLAPRPYPGRGG